MEVSQKIKSKNNILHSNCYFWCIFEESEITMLERYLHLLCLLLLLLSHFIVSDSVRPHRRLPTRLPRPWDSPGKNTGVGCHFLLQCMKGKVKVKSLSHVWLLATPWTAAYQAPPSMGFSRPEYWSGLPLLSPSTYHQSTSFCSSDWVSFYVFKVIWMWQGNR